MTIDDQPKFHDAEVTGIEVDRKAEAVLITLASTKGERHGVHLDGVFAFRADGFSERSKVKTGSRRA